MWRWCHGLSELPARALHRRGELVVHERASEAVTALIEGDDFHQRHTDTVGETAVDLPFHDHRVDAGPTVVNRDETPHLHDTGGRVHVDYADVSPVGIGEVRRVVDARRV